MNIESLKTFVVLADTKSFTKTAKLQYVVQGTVSNRINELEKQVGKTLFVRDKRGVKLTSEGMSFLPYAKKIIRLHNEAIIKARSTNIYVDRVSIGCEPTIYKGILHDNIEDLFSNNRDIAIKLKINKSDEILGLLVDDLLDIGFVYKRPKQSKLMIKEYMQDEIILVCNNNFEIDSEITIDKLNQDMLLYAHLGDSFYEWLFYTLGDKPVIRLSTDYVESIIEYIKSGYGIGFIYKSMVLDELKSGTLREIKIRDVNIPSRSIYMVINRSKLKSEGVKLFRECLT